MIFVDRKVLKKNGYHVQFCSKKYPIDGEFDSDRIKSLSNDLYRAFITSGFKLIQNGSYPYGNHVENKFSGSRCSQY